MRPDALLPRTNRPSTRATPSAFRGLAARTVAARTIGAIRTVRVAALALAAASGLGATACRAETPVTVFAAASLVDALHTLDRDWVAAGHPAPILSLGSSGALARQILAGAPADVFISADQKWMTAIDGKQLTVPGTQTVLAGNTLVLVEPTASAKPVELKSGLDLNAVLGQGGRLSVGNTASVPAGIYAKQALTHLGLWDAVKDRLVPATDVRAALLQVTSGAAQAGIVYGSDAHAASDVKIAGTFPADSHDPIVYPGAVLKRGDITAAKAYLLFLGTPQAQRVFASDGFATPANR